ncbi:16S rRNA (cytosine(1402)-N(4))-methyltransferase RsmH [Aminithiophilus ramosus]|uniref:Ribosomal RNA small subunit methyltransferase H n=2 Tax=Synergistales TaxID=649776 RepID=A0A9Q7AIJ4_9BACT|nr:16S rRNA (cytosine(1402)-N(4))-methyltransferase RsmH [Aminithiophilus ramosus]QTX33529.1 16S rRNA (cytosine(1402)-N(4))-methyltransferase RsmH [Aminithiophilus ramosus]QVL37384.1 16S rRNA (cytosine(1402)-N(4))-methyltransferase RsmH [Synergistota bacterium]
MTEHVPVMITEVLEHVPEELRGWAVDATLGLGGYSEALLVKCPLLSVLGIDQDPQALRLAQERLAPFSSRFRALEGNFRQISALVASLPEKFSVILFDLGLSNLQLTERERGFSFNEDGPLDMRMSPLLRKSAYHWINNSSPQELSEIFRLYGEERYAWPLAKGIVRHVFQKGPIETTGALVSVVRSILPAPIQRKMGGHPARRIFQALRIAVNDEIAALEEALDAVAKIGADPCRVIVVSYHSLEDRVVKHRFRSWKQEGLGRELTRKPLIPTEAEIEGNYKARSAKLRVFRLETEGEGEYGN